MMGFFPEKFNKEERCLLPALSLPFCSLSNCELSNPTSLSSTVVIDKSMERSSQVLQHGNPKIWISF